MEFRVSDLSPEEQEKFKQYKTVQFSSPISFPEARIFHREIISQFDEYLKQEGKFADSLVVIHYTDDHIEEYPYYECYDYKDFKKLRDKFPLAHSVEVYNLKHYREMYFGCIWSSET